MDFNEILNGKTASDSDKRADRAFRMSRGMLHASWIFSLSGRPEIGGAFLGAALPLIFEMKRQHLNAAKRRQEITTALKNIKRK